MFVCAETGEVDYYEFCRLLYPNMDIDTTALDAAAGAGAGEGGPAPAGVPELPSGGGGGIPPPTKKFKLAGGQGLVKMKTMAALGELHAASQAGLCGQGLLSEIGDSPVPSPSGWTRSRMNDGAGAAAPGVPSGTSPGLGGGVRERLAAIKAAKAAAKSEDGSIPTTGTGNGTGTGNADPVQAPDAAGAENNAPTADEQGGRKGDGRSVSPVEPFTKAGDS